MSTALLRLALWWFGKILERAELPGFFLGEGAEQKEDLDLCY